MINLASLNEQQRRVLIQLRLGPVRQQDFDGPNVADGGRPIKRVAARIGELIHEFDCEISSRMVPASETGTARVAEYRLISEPDVGPITGVSLHDAAAVTSEPGTKPGGIGIGMFPARSEQLSGRPRCALFDDDDWPEAA